MLPGLATSRLSTSPLVVLGAATVSTMVLLDSGSSIPFATLSLHWPSSALFQDRSLTFGVRGEVADLDRGHSDLVRVPVSLHLIDRID